MRIAFVLLMCAPLMACGGVAYSVAKGENFVPARRAHAAKVLLIEPAQAYVEVGTLEIRLSRAKHIDQAFRQWLPGWAASELGADAVLPPRPETIAARQLMFETINPYKPYFLFDDGKTIVIGARAIRYLDK